MSRVDELLKGNETLTKKVEDLKEENKVLVNKIGKLRRERDESRKLLGEANKKIQVLQDELNELKKDPDTRMMDMLSRIIPLKSL